MKKVITVAMLVAFAATAAIAADMVTIKTKMGDVTFNHKKHQDNLKDCKICHGEGTPAKLTLGKDKAHTLCKGCHTEKKQGPTGCKDCHKK